jgi:translation initiation factor IF-2
LTKNLKFKIKNTQLATAINLGKLKPSQAKEGKLAEEQTPEDQLSQEKHSEEKHPAVEKKKATSKVAVEKEEKAPGKKVAKTAKTLKEKEPVKTEVRKVKAKSKSAFAPSDQLIKEAHPSYAPTEEPPEMTEAAAEESSPFSEMPSKPITPIEESSPTESRRPALEQLPIAPGEAKGKDAKTEPSAEAPPDQVRKEKKEVLTSFADLEGGDAAAKGQKVKEFRDLKPKRAMRPYDSRERHLQTGGEEGEEHWRRRRHKTRMIIKEEAIPVRPTHLKVRLPISVKDLAVEMKLKSSQLVSKLFLQGVVLTLNDFLDDETMIQLLGHEFGCAIIIDTSEEERIRITDKTIQEEIDTALEDQLQPRAPIVAFMGHVDHGKTSLIDAIRKSNRVAGEAGAITQHIGAFRCQTAVGPITILDTPGHEAFSAMRSRGAEVTDVVVLVIAGDEGIRQQTVEALQQAKNADVTILVAINKCDKPGFNAENVYRQLADHELLPEAWGGSTITVNCSAVTRQGIDQLLEMIALQAEILELHADPHCRARGTVLESAMHKGIGGVTTILVQNGTLRHGDAIVFEHLWGRVKIMRDEHGKDLPEAGPSTPVAIAGLSGLPTAGEEFVVVKDEKEAREISAARTEGQRQHLLLQQKKKHMTLENLLQQTATTAKKVLNVILRVDVQGSLEALKTSLLKIHSDKIELQVIFAGVGAISESDIELAVPSKAVIIGFHTHVESHAEQLIKPLKVEVNLYDIIYHAIDGVKAIMASRLDKIAQENDTGTAQVRAVFKASHLGRIAGCMITEGTIHRTNKIRIIRNGEVVWQGSIASLRRDKEDVREVKKGFECGILLENYSDVQQDDILQAYEVTYISQEL